MAMHWVKKKLLSYINRTDKKNSADLHVLHKNRHLPYKNTREGIFTGYLLTVD